MERPVNCLRLTLANDVGELHRVRPAVEEFLAERHVADRTRYIVQLSVEELVVNVIRHAYEKSGQRKILLEVRVEGHDVFLMIEDDGKPFDPRTAPPPDLQKSIDQRRSGGLGLHIVKGLTDALTYERVQGRNRVTVQVCGNDN